MRTLKTKIQLSGILLPAIVLFACNNSANKSNSPASLDNSPVIAESIQMASGNSLVVCDIASLSDTVNLPLSLLIEDLEIIRLDNSDEALVKEGHITVSENHIGIYNTQAGGYKLFDKSGSYLTTISSHGQGPDEYATSIYDSYIDEQENRIYLLPWQFKKILAFDLSGAPQEHIPLAYSVTKARFTVNSAKKELVAMTMPFQEQKSVVWKQDFQANLIQELPTAHLALKVPDFSNEINSSQNGQTDFSLFHWVSQSDSLYSYDEASNRLLPVFTLRSHGEVPQHEYIDLPGHYVIRMIDPTGMHYPLIFVDKNTLKGSYVNLLIDGLGNIPGPAWIDFSRGYYIANMYSYDLKTQLGKVLANKENITPEALKTANSLYNQITDDDNNIVLTGRLKGMKHASTPKAKTGMANRVTEKTAPASETKPKKENTAEAKAAPTEQNDDDRIYGFKDMKDHIKRIPILANGKEYFRENNKYSTWDSSDKKEVTVGCVVEKNGTTSAVKIIKSCGNEDLDSEAFRLISEIVMLPGKNNKNEPIRCGDFVITVYFPPLE